ncbi:MULTISPECIES: TraM recognition domain-containing protein [unclassified Nocardioides]|uniref:TraM recognition domain-containing protein n=1 Tax=unclassified Nocardioides TaxID=2615069 RepID=UPI0006F52FAD|nr:MULTISPECIES: TraM recognition domain-containing protein [unclassified Nocardioides]KRA30976.1 type VI secretion protein [Nocardioides sp. Root614]KRA87597.1 type VI secretion protein [Nocardioides sp. Root682]
MNPTASGGNDELVNLALLGLVAAFGLAFVLRAAGTAAAILTGQPQPAGDIASGLRVIVDPAHPAQALRAPGLSTTVYWFVVLLLLSTLATIGWALWSVAARWHHRAARNPHRLQGTATGRDIDTVASKKALVRRGQTLRPSLSNPKAGDVGYLIGRSRGREVWASVEDSILVIGPPRSGKGLHLVINAILDAPGAVVTTSTRPDNIVATIGARRERGPVAVFDPQRLTSGLPELDGNGVRWSPIRGCEQPITAMIRAAGLAATTGLSSGGVESGGFWEGKARSAIQALLHAAALGNLSTRELFEWSLSASSAADAIGILASDTQAAPGWSDSLDTMINADPRTRDSIWMAVSQALTCLADPAVLDAVNPSPGEEFDPRQFLERNGTLYLLATGAGAGASWPLVAAFMEDLAEVARHIAAGSSGSRLDPPLLLALDEIGNLSPLPSLPVLMAEGGGTGITTMPVLQSLAQARSRWGDHAASTIWDASIVKIILGGASASKDLQELSVLIGERDENADSITIGDHGQRSHQRSTRRRAVLPPERIRTLPFGTGLVLLRSAPPIVADLRPWTAR